MLSLFFSELSDPGLSGLHVLLVVLFLHTSIRVRTVFDPARLGSNRFFVRADDPDVLLALRINKQVMLIFYVIY